MGLDLKDVSVWLRGLIEAGIQGGTVMIGTTMFAPETFNFDDGLGKLIKVSCFSAVIGMAKYLSKKPLPEDLEDKK